MKGPGESGMEECERTKTRYLRDSQVQLGKWRGRCYLAVIQVGAMQQMIFLLVAEKTKAIWWEFFEFH